MSKAPNPQLLPRRHSINGCPLLRVCVHGVCVCVCVCLCSLLCVSTWMGKCRARIPSMGYHTWLYVTFTSLHIGPYNTQLLLAFLNTLYRDLIPKQERGLVRPHLPNYVVVWDNASFHRTNIVKDWFAALERMTVEFLPPYSPFLNPIEEFFSAWRWKVYDLRPQVQMSLLNGMDAACEDITADHCRGWVRL